MFDGGRDRTASESSRSARGDAGHTDFRVVVWYRRDRPLETFKYQVYDVRKGQYTPAVDAWIQLLRTKYPAYDITIREVDLAREQERPNR